MGFNANDYKVTEKKKLPVVLLLDTSGSMSGEKIDSLYDATIEMIHAFVDAEVREQNIEVAIITFGSSVELHTPYMSAKDLQTKGIKKFYADGMTPMGMALKMAKDMIEDKNITPSRVYKPAVVLVSDGEPNDNWESEMDKFINTGRSQKCQRFAVAIGNDANKSVLERFTGDKSMVLLAEDAKDISEQFKIISMSVSTRAVSSNPSNVPKFDATYDNNKLANSDDEDDLY